MMTETTPVLKFTSDTPLPDLERAVREVLSPYPGSWTVSVDQELAGGWWCMVVSTEGFRRSFLVSPSEQTAPEIARQLEEALKSLRPGRPRWGRG